MDRIGLGHGNKEVLHNAGRVFSGSGAARSGGRGRAFNLGSSIWRRAYGCVVRAVSWGVQGKQAPVSFSCGADVFSGNRTLRRGQRCIQAGRTAKKLDVSDQAAYGKIRRLRQSLSNAIVFDRIVPLMEMFPDTVKIRVPACFNNYNVYCIDGKKPKDVAKRLKETRGVAGKLLGGKTLVALSVHEQLVVAMSSSLDGEATLFQLPLAS